MPFRSKSQQRYFYANRKRLEREGVDVGEWSEATDYSRLPETADKTDKKAEDDFVWTPSEAAGSRDPTDVLWSLPQRRVYIAKSGVHGRGTFCTWTTHRGRVVALALVVHRGKAWRTTASRFINHSTQPNTRLKNIGGMLFLVAIKRLSPGTELTLDYRTLGKDYT